jgi:hypothetical protein
LSQKYVSEGGLDEKHVALERSARPLDAQAPTPAFHPLDQRTFQRPPEPLPILNEASRLSGLPRRVMLR